MTAPTAVVLAAGEGRRLRPLTERWPKPILPIDGRAVIATLLRELATAVEEVTIVTGHLAELVESLVGDGSAFGLRIRFVRQPQPLGSADAVRRALAGGARPPLIVSAADTVFRPGDVRAAALRWLASKAPGALGVRRVPAEEVRARSRVRVADGRVLEIVEKPAPDPSDGALVLAGAPLWFLGPEIVAELDALPGPPFQLATAFGRAIGRGLPVAAVEIGRTRDLTSPDDVIRQNFPYLGTMGVPGTRVEGRSGRTRLRRDGDG